MAIKINFDSANIPERPTLLLAKRDGSILGQLQTSSLRIKDCLNDTPELYFEVYKNISEDLWDKIDNFKLVWVKEANMWFDITVDLTEDTDGIKKTVNCVGLGNSELSQINLYDIEINTEDDIAREDYIESTIFYNEYESGASLLNRITEKADHYTIGHVDESLRTEQRTFSFSNTTLLDALNEIAEEIQCLFVVKVYTDDEGNISRTISAYDLLNYCTSCHHREENMIVCPECESDNILSGYGEDTTIFLTSDELADSIDISSDTDSVKNCFHLEAGDDYMTSTVINCNPNGSQDIWYIPQNMRDEMSDTLQEALSNYDDLYEKYQTNETDETLIQMSKYNYDTYEQFYSLYDGALICSFTNSEITVGRKYYLKKKISTDEPAVCGWVTIFDSANNKYWNLPFVMCSSKQYYSYYWENNDGSENNEVTLSQTLTFDGTTYYYNTNSGAMEGEIGSTGGAGKYFGVFNSLAETANYVYYNYIKKDNPYNMISNKVNTMLDRYETQNSINEDSKHTEIAYMTDPLNYPELMKKYYDVVDFNLLLQSSLMPTVDLSETDTSIEREIAKINALYNDTVAVQNSSLNNVSDETATSAVKNYIKWHISSNYKLDVKMRVHDGDYISVDATLSPYSSLSEETAQTATVAFDLSVDSETYLQNRIKSKLVSETESDDIYYDTVSLFGLTNDSEFAYVIMFFSYNKLQSLSDACQSCLDVLITQGVDDTNNTDLYNTIYLPYYNKKQIIDNELALRKKEIEQIAYYDDYGNLSSGILWVMCRGR